MGFVKDNQVLLTKSVSSSKASLMPHAHRMLQGNKSLPEAQGLAPHLTFMTDLGYVGSHNQVAADKLSPCPMIHSVVIILSMKISTLPGDGSLAIQTAPPHQQRERLAERNTTAREILHAMGYLKSWRAVKD